MASFDQEAKEGNDAKNPTNTPDALAGDVEEANGNTLKRALEGRHIQMIAMKSNFSIADSAQGSNLTNDELPLTRAEQLAQVCLSAQVKRLQTVALLLS
ncbi:hypothetical protein AFCA_012778 [Aspergillus flavus]|nr:hypothetical protein AFCA_012778 [Aspergillus flavus]